MTSSPLPLSRISALFLTILAIGCGNSHPQREAGKSRSEQLKEIPYQNEVIEDNTSDLINITVQKVLNRTKSLNDVSIFYLTTDGKLEQVKGDWPNGTAAIKEANELWRTKPLTLTIVAFPSFTQNAVNGETSDIWVIEINHHSVSRTCRMFFNSPSPKNLTTIKC